MFSNNELNQVMKLNTNRNKIVDWQPGHLHFLEMNDHDIDWYSRVSNYTNMIKNQHNEGSCFSGVCDGKIVCCFGIYNLWGDVYEAWLIPHRQIGRNVVPFHRGSQRFFTYAMSKYRIKRLQITVSSQNAHAVYWAEKCYFKKEGLMKHYGPDNNDYFMMGRYQ
jgi:RimJ/RimL family protein N-acetyltransferase